MLQTAKPGFRKGHRWSMNTQNWAFLNPPPPSTHYDVVVTIKHPLLRTLWPDLHPFPLGAYVLYGWFKIGSVVLSNPTSGAKWPIYANCPTYLANTCLIKAPMLLFGRFLKRNTFWLNPPPEVTTNVWSWESWSWRRKIPTSAHLSICKSIVTEYNFTKMHRR